MPWWRMCVAMSLGMIYAVDGSWRRDLPLQSPCGADGRTEIVQPQTSLPHPHNSGMGFPPSLRVQLTWKGREREVTLFQSDVTSGKMVMTYEEENDESNSSVADIGGESCYYQGFVQGESASFAALSACQGLAGYLQTAEDLIFIQPASSPSSSSSSPPKEHSFLWSSRPHLLYTCNQSPQPSAANFSDSVEPLRQPFSGARAGGQRRSVGGRKRYVEVAVVADHTVVDMHGQQRVKDYVLTLLNIVNSVYQHESLGVNLRVVVTEIILLKQKDQKHVVVKGNAHSTVLKFCAWMTSRQRDVSNVKHDIAVLLTREKIGPAGYAPISAVCNPTQSCAAITDEGFTSGFIIAHEMAHVLGLFHDGHTNPCRGPQYSTAIMAPLVEAKLNRFWWSECSRKRLQYLLPSLRCLEDAPQLFSEEGHYDLDSGADLPSDMGRHWSLDFQCRLEFGEQFQLCTTFPSDHCSVLWCSQKTNPHLCRTKRGPPAPGTACGPDRPANCYLPCHGVSVNHNQYASLTKVVKRQRKAFMRELVYSPNRRRSARTSGCTYVGDQAAVDGQWSGWSDWESCSTACGVGITRRSRQCSNPRPAYGGKGCEGEADSWDTCAAEGCESYYDYRAAHCAVWNDMNIRAGYHDWLPYPPDSDSDRCKQTCISRQTKEVVTIDVEVSDGTPCSYDHPSNICFLGKCLTVGCDGVQNSTKDYDSCGICGGDDSQCKNVSGLFQKVPASGQEYEPIVFLPKGARHIHIVLKGRTKHFLALKLADYGTYPLNGDRRQETPHQFILAGARVEYSSKPGIQTISSRGPLHVNLEVMLYPNRDRRRTSVTYQYSVHKGDVTLEKRKYQWRFKGWSDCSVTCGKGVTTILYACYDKESGEQVSEDRCQYLDPPRKDQAPCSRVPCSPERYIWVMTNDWSECSAEGCGEEGEQRQGYECQLYFSNNGSYMDVALDLCDASTTPHYTRPCTAPPCEARNWTVGPWAQCSVTCGQGQQSRRVYCGDPDTDSDDLCSDTPPPQSQACHEKPCEGPVSDEGCRDKYAFCAFAYGLHLKCQSPHFHGMCCKSCTRLENSALSP